jgi:hypothetical protein
LLLLSRMIDTSKSARTQPIESGAQAEGAAPEPALRPSDRFSVRRGLECARDNWDGILATSLMIGGGLWLADIPLHSVPVLNFLSQMSGLSGVAADILTALTGTTLASFVAGFCEPKRAGADAALTGANMGVNDGA